MALSGASRRGYHDNIVEHYENPRNVGSLDKKDKFVGTVSCKRYRGGIEEEEEEESGTALRPCACACFEPFFWVAGEKQP